MYLMIENQGVAPPEAFTMLGDSGSRNKDVSGLIGQFGSGNKHGINLLLRKGLETRVYTDTTRLEFFPKKHIVKDADGTRRETFPVKCRLSGPKTNKTIDCGWTLGFGELDWNKTSMALREFVSNAIDCSKVMGTEPEVTLIPDGDKSKVRAKAGTTRIFIKADDPEVTKFYYELDKHFLHFSVDDNNSDFLRKSPDSVGPRVYRCETLIDELPSAKPATFDYNFKAEEIEIDECRNSSSYALRGAIAMKINQADPETLCKLFTAMITTDTYEATLDEFYLTYHTGDEIKANWKAAWKLFAGDAVIASPEMLASPLAEHIVRKGHSIKSLRSESFCKVCARMGIPTVSSVMGTAAAEGRVEVPVTADATAAVSEVWGWMEAYDMTCGKPAPTVKSFKELMDGERSVMGFYQHGTQEVNIREDLAGGFALKVALEECAHYVSGAGDCSRDFQQYFIDMLVTALK